jgi:hypothetical protein
MIEKYSPKKALLARIDALIEQRVSHRRTPPPAPVPVSPAPVAKRRTGGRTG